MPEHDARLVASSNADDQPVEQVNPFHKRRDRWWRVLIIGVLLLFVWLCAIGLRRQLVSAQRATGEAPDFTVTTFTGETVQLTNLRGKGVVLNFWASWCTPCREEAPMLEAAWRRERANGILFIGLDYLDQEHAAKAFLEEFNITYPTGPDRQSMAARHYRITGVPETFFIGPDGKIVSQMIGGLRDEADLARRLDAIRPATYRAENGR